MFQVSSFDVPQDKHRMSEWESFQFFFIARFMDTSTTSTLLNLLEEDVELLNLERDLNIPYKFRRSF